MNNQIPLKTNPQNNSKPAKRVQQPSCPIAAKVAPTLQGKTSPKSEVKLSKPQLNEASWLFRQYDQPKPGWLRMSFKTNRRRTKVVTQLLADAGLDESWCSWVSDDGEWSTLLHQAWHQLKGATL